MRDSGNPRSTDHRYSLENLTIALSNYSTIVHVSDKGLRELDIAVLLIRRHSQEVLHHIPLEIIFTHHIPFESILIEIIVW